MMIASRSHGEQAAEDEAGRQEGEGNAGSPWSVISACDHGSSVSVIILKQVCMYSSFGVSVIVSNGH